MPVADYVQIYRNYDKAVVDWVRLNRYRDKPILTVFATPERAFGQIRHLIRQKRGEDPGVVPLPFVSLGRVMGAHDWTRFNASQIRRMYYNPDQTKYYGTKMPQPITLTYQIDIWCRDLTDLDAQWSQFLLRLSNGKDVYLTVDHPFPFGERIVLFTYEGFQDRSELEPVENKRVLRRSLTFQGNAWVVYPADEVGIVKTQHIQIWESTDLDTPSYDELLDTVEIP
jgi:hypothetical protein